MDAGTVGGQAPMEFDWACLETPDPNQLWVDYDDVTDSFVLYITGEPQKGIHVWIGDDAYVIVDPISRQAIGLQVEAWARRFVPAHKEIAVLWASVKPGEAAWSSLLRLMGLWTVVSFKRHADAGLQPA